jgi:hypothetical protein
LIVNLGVHQAEVGLLDQGGGLERLAGLLLGQLRRCQLAQLVIDQRQELLGGLGIALLDGGQDTRDVGHASDGITRDSAEQEKAGKAPASRRGLTGLMLLVTNRACHGKMSSLLVEASFLVTSLTMSKANVPRL